MTASSTHIALRFSIGIEAGFVGNWLYFIALTEALPTAGRSSQMPGSPAEKDRPDILLSLFFFSIFFIFLQLTLIPPCSCCSSVFHRFISIAHWAETFLYSASLRSVHISSCIRLLSSYRNASSFNSFHWSVHAFAIGMLDCKARAWGSDPGQKGEKQVSTTNSTYVSALWPTLSS